MTPQELSTLYFAAMRAQDVEALLAIFTLDGVIIWPNGTRIEGHDAIRTAYDRLFSMPTNNPTPGLLMLGQDCFANEVHSRLPDGSERRTCNVFRTSAGGLIAEMSSYRRD